MGKTSLYLHLCGSAMPCLLVGTAQDRPKCHGDVDVPQPKEGVLEILLDVGLCCEILVARAPVKRCITGICTLWALSARICPLQIVQAATAQSLGTLPPFTELCSYCWVCQPLEKQLPIRNIRAQWNLELQDELTCLGHARCLNCLVI